MSHEEALDWIQQVNGKLYKNPQKADHSDEWVAVVRTPSLGGRRGKLIIASGRTLQQATSAAETRWNELWSDLSAVH